MHVTAVPALLNLHYSTTLSKSWHWEMYTAWDRPCIHICNVDMQLTCNNHNNKKVMIRKAYWYSSVPLNSHRLKPFSIWCTWPTEVATNRPVGSHSMSVHMKCSAALMGSKSSALKNSSWPFMPCRLRNSQVCTLFGILCLTVWGVEPDVTHQTSWLGSTGECGVPQNQTHRAQDACHLVSSVQQHLQIGSSSRLVLCSTGGTQAKRA